MAAESSKKDEDKSSADVYREAPENRETEMVPVSAAVPAETGSVPMSERPIEAQAPQVPADGIPVAHPIRNGEPPPGIVLYGLPLPSNDAGLLVKFVLWTAVALCVLHTANFIVQIVLNPDNWGSEFIYWMMILTIPFCAYMGVKWRSLCLLYTYMVASLCCNTVMFLLSIIVYIFILATVSVAGEDGYIIYITIFQIVILVLAIVGIVYSCRLVIAYPEYFSDAARVANSDRIRIHGGHSVFAQPPPQN